MGVLTNELDISKISQSGQNGYDEQIIDVNDFFLLAFCTFAEQFLAVQRLYLRIRYYHKDL